MSSQSSPPHTPRAVPSAGHDVRVRFCPSPTGTPHVGMARTALFNWAFARHHGGAFVFRVEDTDASRDSERSVGQLLDALSWLGLDYDEGPGVGGPHAPYRQSERVQEHRRVAGVLLEAGFAYESYSTPEEVQARHLAAGRDPKLGYDNYDRDLSAEQVAAYRDQGREPVLRLRMPQEDITFTDLVRGEVTFAAGSVPDFVIMRSGNQPLYTLVNPVDDAAMQITHVIRGEDLLSSTPRQIALYRALVAIGEAHAVPTFAHLPLVLGEGNRKLSKRDPASDLFHHRDRGFVREGMINYLALLGWAIGGDRDVFSPDELVAAFEVDQVNPNPARWDQRKAEAINAEHLRAMATPEFAARLTAAMQDMGIVSEPSSPTASERMRRLAPLVQSRIQVLSEAAPMVAPFYTSDGELPIADDAWGQLKESAPDVLRAALDALEPLDDGSDGSDERGGAWEARAIEATLRAAIVDGLGIKPRLAFGPLRTALSGQRVSPPLFESMEILGKASTLRRLTRLLEMLTQARAQPGESTERP
ncbi:MAG TPA: glutamate--tRNA ligase [Ornithinimicrobium sp.]|uniref:glutamate--tRNA ligase n=1 Tax=Ornithinimicrobium sp. TaxID=1977084 RepID=UPI002B498D60|nr:glutamate--tRNA ligase [Ornithinimicrobium sp.]HKJ12280.1 glutamate--tRNA ligase [Ornithinimicrobium sp.]